MDVHDAAVAALATRVRGFHDRREPFRIYHGSTNGTRRSERRPENTVDTSALDRVLSVDEGRRVVVAEPNVPMDALVAATLPHGLVPPVVMEFPGITVGGGFSGTSGESSSFRHGTFDMTVNWVEIVLPSGEVTRASQTDEKPDLFWGAASALGTLGVVTLLEVRLVEAKKYVQVTYSLASSFEGTKARIEEEMAKDENDYVDAIVFSRDSSIICSGRLVDTIPDGHPPRQLLRRKDPWYYLTVQKFQKQLMKSPDSAATHFIPLVDYLFRYDRGGFWCARYSFNYFFMPFNRVTRFVLDPLLRTRVMYRAMHKSGLSDFYVLQDVGIPLDRAAEFHAWADDNLGIYPVWLCPLLARRDPAARHGIHAAFADPDAPAALLNFGLWAPVSSSDRREAVRVNRELERKVQEVGGKKCLYAHTYYTEDEFWAHYDRASYEALRVKYQATHLPSVYDKVKVDVDAEEAAARSSKSAKLRAAAFGVWPVRGAYGVYKALRGGDYLLSKKSGRDLQTLKKDKRI